MLCWPAQGRQEEQTAPGAPPVVATVNGHPITRKDLERRIAQSRSMDPERFANMSVSEREKAIARLLRARIVQELEYQEAVRRGIEAPEREVSLALAQARRAYSSDEDFEKSLLAASITVAEWREEMKKSLMIRKLEESVGDREKTAWIKSLWDRSRIWMSQP